MFNRRLLRRAARCAAADVMIWTFVALAFAAQGHLVASYRGTPQPWWPSFGYSLAIFSVWTLLAPVILAALWTGKAHLRDRWLRGLALAAGLPIVGALHVMMFALIYWPVYNGGTIPNRWAMAERMALRNLDTNALFYVLVVGAGVAWIARTRPIADAPAASTEGPAQATDEPPPLRVPGRGGVHLLKPADIDWIGAAGDYAEVHADGQTHLLEASLVALERRLPARQFARIHRGTLVRLDRIAEVRGLGRGDALVRLADGTELRLSRRYRTNLAALVAPRDPARPPVQSRSPIEPGPVS